MFQMNEPYKTRPIRFLDLYETNGWKLKLYGIAYNRDLPREELIDAAKKIASATLPQITESVYGVGFIGVHDGRGSNFLFIDWWQDENELHHHVFISPSDKPCELVEKTSTGLIACVWDMKVMCFERQAWLDRVLTSGVCDFDDYLSARLNIDV